MVFDGAGANAELMGDNFVGVALNKMAEHVTLA